MKARRSPRRQRGAMIITAALFLLFPLGFMGIALDFGRLFVARTELQTAGTAVRWPPRLNSTERARPSTGRAARDRPPATPTT